MQGLQACGGKAMKVRIEYEYDGSYNPPYWAKSEGRYRQGRSFEEARDSLILALKRSRLKVDPPPPEEVEI